jgi:hypothetical protein
MLKRIITAAFLGATLAQAQPSALSGPQIKELVAGATLVIVTPLGTKLPVHYARDGRLSGEAGALAAYLGADVDKGRWWVASDQLCHKWNRWFGSEPQCLRLSKEGHTIRLRSQDGYEVTGRVAAAPVLQAKAVPPRAEPERGWQAAPPDAPAPAPAAPEERPRQPVETASKPPQEAAKETLALVAPAPVPASAAKAPLAPAAAVPSASLPSPVEPKEAVALVPPAPVPASAAKASLAPAAVPSASPPSPAEPGASRAAQPAFRSGFRVVNVRGHDVLNVRSGPSSDSDIVGGLPPGSRGIAITSACRSAWCPVQHRATNGWVNRAYLAPEEPASPLPRSSAAALGEAVASPSLRDAADAPRACLTAEVRALLDRVERQFGPVKAISTCRPGAFIAGTAHLSRHASGNAVDFLAGTRKAAIVEWLMANHRDGGTMTYADMDHIHIDVGPHFVSIANGPHWLSWRDSARDFPHPQRPVSRAN